MEKVSIPEAMSILKIFARQLYLQGFISIDQLDDVPAIRDSFIKALDGEDDMPIAIDHTDNLIEHAKYFEATGYKEMAIMLYATFFEHSINKVISHSLREHEFQTNTKNQILRGANIQAKFSWLLELLHLPKFNDSHRQFILKIAEERNAFTHYKFNAVFQNKADTQKGKINQLLNDVPKSIKYMKFYTSKVEYKGKKGIVTERLSKLSNM